MPRSRAAPASKPSSAPRSSAPPPARPAQPQQQQSHQQQQNHQQQQQPQVHHVVHHHTGGGGPMGGMSRGPGMMGTMAAAAAGSVAGNYISNSLFSNSQPGNPPPQEVQNPENANAMLQQAQESKDPCKAYFESYAKCMEINAKPQQDAPQPNAAASCQWAWDMILQCRQSNGL